MRNPQVKRKTSLGKICDKQVSTCLLGGRLKPTEPSARGRAKDIRDVALVPLLSDGQQRSAVYTLRKERFTVPVVDSSQVPLMPTKPSRARRWIKAGKATGFWKRGVFCVRLNTEPSSREYQSIAVGIDPGSKREAFTVKSKAHTYLNVLTETPYWVGDAVEARRNARRTRRYRKSPCRKNRRNRKRGSLPPSTKARWQWKLRTSNWLLKIYPITDFIAEDVAASTKKGKRKWNASFSPLEVGKQWFYEQLKNLCRLTLKRGHETAALRKEFGLTKDKSKLTDAFDCHNVDSWVLANAITGGHKKPDNASLIKLVPLQFHRRQLHVFQPAKGGIRKAYGGTRSMGFTRGSIVKHPKFGVCHIGGNMDGKVSLHDSFTGKRLTQSAKVADIKFLSYASWRREV